MALAEDEVAVFHWANPETLGLPVFKKALYRACISRINRVCWALGLLTVPNCGYGVIGLCKA